MLISNIVCDIDLDWISYTILALLAVAAAIIAGSAIRNIWQGIKKEDR